MVVDDDLIPETRTVDKPESGIEFEPFPQYILRMSGGHQLGLCLIAMMTTLLELVPIELQRRIIDTAIENQNVSALATFGIAYAGVLLLHQLTKFLFRLYQAWIAESTMKNTRRRLIEIHSTNAENPEQNGGSAVSVIGAEIEGIGTFVGEHISDASANAMMLLGASAYMLYVEPQLAVYALLFFIPQIVLTPFMQRLLNRLIEIRVELLRKLGNSLTDTELSGNGSQTITGKIYSNRIRYALVKYAMKSLINLLNSLGPLTVVLYGGYLAVHGETTAGIIVAFLSGFQRMSGPVRGLITFYRLAAQTNVQHQKVEQWIEQRKTNA